MPLMAPEPLVHVVDDDDAVRDSLAFLLRTDGLDVRTYESPLELLATERPIAGCVVTDVRMPEMSGIELVRRLKEVGETVPVVVMTGHADVPLAVEAMKAGVVDFIEKPFDDEMMLTAIRSALARQPTNPPENDARTAAIRQRLESLSAREQEVLEGLVGGKPNKVIAYDLGISPRTVEVYRANVMTKMQAGSLSELVRMAMLIEGPR
jgi:two-component system, LuxR family, response regulator FixJ